MVKRWGYSLTDSTIVEREYGCWVEHDDYLALQAKLDAVMLEYCPDDMTDEQWVTWGKNQVAETKLNKLNEEIL